MTDRDYPEEEKTPRKRQKKGKHPMQGKKQSAATIAKRVQTMKAKREALATHAPDVIGAIAELRAAKKAILAQLCAQQIKDLGDLEIGVFRALKLLQGG